MWTWSIPFSSWHQIRFLRLIVTFSSHTQSNENGIFTLHILTQYIFYVTHCMKTDICQKESNHYHAPNTQFYDKYNNFDIYSILLPPYRIHWRSINAERRHLNIVQFHWIADQRVTDQTTPASYKNIHSFTKCAKLSNNIQSSEATATGMLRPVLSYVDSHQPMS